MNLSFFYPLSEGKGAGGLEEVGEGIKQKETKKKSYTQTNSMVMTRGKGGRRGEKEGGTGGQIVTGG